VGIDNLGAAQPVLTVRARPGPLASMLKFTTSSPVDGWLDGFTGNLQGQAMLSSTSSWAFPCPARSRSGVGDILLAGNQLGFRTLPIPPCVMRAAR
jgi:hypothetical protein